MSNKLYLTLKAKWYDMIEAGIKLEEYRDIKPFWVKRLTNVHVGVMGGDILDRHRVIAHTIKKFDTVVFARGGHFHPRLPQMELELKGIEIDEGNPDWGAVPKEEYFVIKLGKILSTSTPTQ